MVDMAKKKKTKKKKTVQAPKDKTEQPAADIGKSAEFEQVVSEQLQEPPQRGPGRPPKQPAAGPIASEPVGPALTNRAIKAGVKIPFSLWADANQLEDLKLKDDEAVELADAVKGILDYYCPNIPVPVLIWSNLTLTLTAVVTPRLQLINKIKEEKKAADDQQGTNDQGTRRSPAATPGYPKTADIRT